MNREYNAKTSALFFSNRQDVDTYKEMLYNVTVFSALKLIDNINCSVTEDPVTLHCFYCIMFTEEIRLLCGFLLRFR